MSGRIIGVVIVAAALIGGALVYYLQVYAFYEDVPPDDARTKIALTAIHSGAPEALPVTDFQGIDADSSPLRYRACFQVANSLAMLTETFVIIDNAVPLQAPAWFDCFDATDIGEALEEGRALAFWARPRSPTALTAWLLSCPMAGALPGTSSMTNMRTETCPSF